MINIKQDIISQAGWPVKGVQYGKHCFIYRGEKIKYIKRQLGREDDKLCLKIFYNQDKGGNWGDDPKKDLSDKRNSTLDEANQIQNICWYHDLAPRVYGMTKISWSGSYGRGEEKLAKDRICDAQITDDLGDEHGDDKDAENIYERILTLGKIYGWQGNYKETRDIDVLQDKFVDFQVFNLAKDYKEKIKKKYIESCTYGKKYYHNIPEFDLNGCPRENENRVKWLGLDKIDFKNKYCLDLGMAGGWFCRYMASKGSFVDGIDKGGYGSNDPILGTFLVNNYLKQFNIDVFGYDLKDKQGLDLIEKYQDYDIVLLLSMTFHIGVPSWLNKLAKLVIVEDNSKNRDANKELKKLFKKVELRGKTLDRDSEFPIYYCQ
jgi:2-polyprenyl-3-methyl-5-hydroxy-6-metoxy-1,4-benzoquinol methylase